WEIANFYTDDFINGLHKLGMIQPQHLVKATDTIPQQLDLIRALVTKGFTYQIDDGIYFDTSKFSAYADFAHLNLESLKAGARVEYNQQKRNPSDFALWKYTPAGQKRDMEWEFEGKMGFPGWHVECSAIALSLLGNTIDIHTGGIDHIPVHHTNEIAQSESATGVRFSNYWLHNNHLKVDGTKISKSFGNGYTLQDLSQKGFSPLDFRMFVLQGHYRSEGNFTFEGLQAAKSRLDKWLNTAALRHQTISQSNNIESGSTSDITISLHTASQAIAEAVSNDLGTPEALRIIDEIFTEVAKNKLEEVDRQAFLGLLDIIDKLLGLQLVESSPDIDSSAKQLIEKRNTARIQKDWVQADQIRNELQQQGIILRDIGDDSIWEYYAQ
ncbi:cysteine--tRNA ligase, partial [Candidatus Saccharibacteria bacterium]|nr:cysteine--tRNA ligase [Candidatus Saccharibacteria bacterium]